MKRYRELLLPGIVLLAAAGLYAAAVRAQATAVADARAEIMRQAQAYVEAFQKADAKALAEFWTLDGDYVNLEGHEFKGRKAIAEDFARVFAESKNMSLRIEVLSLRFPTPDTAIEDGVTSVMAPDAAVPSRARYTNFLVKVNGQWLLSSVRETEYMPPNNYEYLRPLEWAIGEWVQDTKEAHVARVAFDWSPDRNFILGVRAVGVKDLLMDNGSQRIGWDPAAKQIRSWSFEADGGFGEAAWKQEGDNKWVVTMSSVLRSGSLMISTTTITRADPDTLTWQITDQKLDGKPLPDSAVITMKREH
jgi:uncharacterized protein (TIGR02246 family)